MPDTPEKTVDEPVAQEFLDTIRVFDSKDVPPKVQQIVALRAMGKSNVQIARMLGYADASSVRHMLARWDPTREIERADAMRRLLLVSMAEQIAFKAFLGIAKDAEAFDGLSPADKMKIASDCSRFVKNMGGMTRLKVADDEKRVLDVLLGEDTIEAEVVE